MTQLNGDSVAENEQVAKLTKTFIDGLTYGKSGNAKDIWWDSGLPGFGVRVYPSGKKAFVIEYRVNRRKRLKTIGAAGTELLTLDRGKERAKRDLYGLLDDIDPLRSRDQQREAGTFEELAAAYIERHAKPHNKTWKTDQYRLSTKINKRFGGLLVLSITHDDIATFHGDFGKKSPYEANRQVRLLSNVFNKAIKWGMVPDSFKNPATGIDYFKEEKRDRFVTPEELPRLMEEISKEASIYTKSALWLYLLMGMRKTELLSAKWEQIDFHRKELRLPDTKAGRAHYLPLTDAAIKVLEDIPRVSENPHVFVGARKGKHLVNIDKAWRRIRKDAGLEDVRIHDLRRTLGSWLAQSGNSLHLIGRILNHSNASTTQVYARFQQDNIRTALDQHGKQMMGIAGKSTPAEVIRLKK